MTTLPYTAEDQLEMDEWDFFDPTFYYQMPTFPPETIPTF